MSDATPRELPLHARHAAAGARFAPFAGWNMPVRYSQIREEHLAVRTRCGLFDVSHMGEVFVRGPGALDAVQTLVTNDVSTLEDGQAIYTVMCQPDGGIVDDLIVYRLGPEELLLCVNAGNRDKDARWIADHVGARADVHDESDAWVQLAVQGPEAVSTVRAALGEDVQDILPFHVAQLDGPHGRILAARTGYTGEDGLELYLPVPDAERVWDALVASGRDAGMVHVGLGARDSLRLEARLLLYGNEIDESTNPIEAGLGWVVKLDKGDFVGRDALQAIQQEGPARRLRGLLLDGPQMMRGGMPVQLGDERVGITTSGSIGYALGETRIALAYLDAAHADVDRAEVLIRDRPHTVQVVRKPFYRRPRNA